MTTHEHKSTVQPDLFPDSATRAKTKKDIMVRDEMNMAKFPLCVFSRGEVPPVVKYTPREGVELELISNPEADSQIPRGRHLDFLYALMYILAVDTHYKFNSNTIYFYATEAISIADKPRNAESYRTLFEAVHYYRWMGMKSTELQTVFGGKIKNITQVVGIIQDYLIINGKKAGRKKSHEVDPSGYYKVVFTDYFMDNLRSAELSKYLNFSFMMRLSSPIAKRYYRLLDAWREEERRAGNKSFTLTRDVSDIAWQLPLANQKHLTIIRRTIDPLNEELIELQYLHDVQYVKEKGGTKAIFSFSELTTEQAVIYTELTQRGIAIFMAKKAALGTEFTPEEKMEIIRAFDILKATAKDKKYSAGYLATMLVNPNFEMIRKVIDDHDRMEAVRNAEVKRKRNEKMMMLYMQHIEEAATDYISQLPEQDLTSLRSLAEEKNKSSFRVSKRTHEISIERTMKEIVQEKYLKVPSFAEWSDQNRELLR